MGEGVRTWVSKGMSLIKGLQWVDSSRAALIFLAGLFFLGGSSFLRGLCPLHLHAHPQGT